MGILSSRNWDFGDGTVQNDDVKPGMNCDCSLSIIVADKDIMRGLYKKWDAPKIRENDNEPQANEK